MCRCLASSLRPCSCSSHLSAADPAIMPTTAAASQGILLRRPVIAKLSLPRDASKRGMKFCRQSTYAISWQHQNIIDVVEHTLAYVHVEVRRRRSSLQKTSKMAFAGVNLCLERDTRPFHQSDADSYMHSLVWYEPDQQGQCKI